MSLPDYQIVLRSRDDGLIKIVYGPEELDKFTYERRLNEIGSVTLDLPSSDTTYDMFLLDDFIEIQRRRDDTGVFEVEGTYFVRSTQRYVTNGQEFLTVGGKSLEHLLKRRIIDPDDDPNAIGGYTIVAGLADSVIWYVTIYNVGPNASGGRQAEGLAVPDVSGIGLPIGDKLRHQNLYETLQDLSARGKVDFRIVRTDGRNMRFECGKFGQDRTFGTNYGFGPMLLLQPSHGNLGEPSLVVDRAEEITVLYALGQGPGETRLVAKVPDPRVLDSPWNRCEDSEDFRNLDRSSPLTLVSAGQGVLDDNAQSLEEFTFTIDPATPGSIYRSDWDLGDSLTVWWGTFQSDYRITGLTVTVDPSGESFDVEVADA